MNRYRTAVVDYKDGEGSVARAVELSGALDKVKKGDHVFLKPNIVVWSKDSVFPKWGVITTSRVIEETVVLLKDLGVGSITIGEGIINLTEGNTGVADDARERLGYNTLKKRYGVEFVDVMESPSKKVEVESGLNLYLNQQALESDFFINLPVMKTHAQTVVSLGMKNLKGLLNMASRKRCHSTDEERPLDFMISRLPEFMPPSATIIDGIYTLERGPAPDGKARRTNVIVASGDMLSADMVGAKILGHEPSDVSSLVHAAEQAERALDLSDIEITGEGIDAKASYHEWDFQYNEGDLLHRKMEKMGIEGLTYRKYDSTLCTYCSIINGAVLTSIFLAWKGASWGNIDILTGKKMKPLPGNDKTVLLGQCMYNLNKDDPNIKELIAVKGCPPDPDEVGKALHKAGIPVELGIFHNIEKGLGLFMHKYKEKPEFEEIYYTVE